jgi:hypothetical protein
MQYRMFFLLCPCVVSVTGSLLHRNLASTKNAELIFYPAVQLTLFHRKVFRSSKFQADACNKVAMLRDTIK